MEDLLERLACNKIINTHVYCNDTDINVHLPYCKFCPWNQQVVITVKKLIDHINDPFEVCVPWWTSIQSDRGRTKTMRLWKRCRVIGLLLSLSLLLLECLLFQIKWSKYVYYYCFTIYAKQLLRRDFYQYINIKTEKNKNNALASCFVIISCGCRSQL